MKREAAVAGLASEGLALVSGSAGAAGRLRLDFLLKTDSGYPRDAEVTLFTL